MSVHVSPSPGRRGRRGISSLEVIVSLTLLASTLAVSTPLIVAHGRLLKSQRNHRLALEELSNHIERLSALPPEALPAAMERIVPSPLAGQRLPGATLRGQLADSDLGQRLTLEIWWDEPNRQAAPLRLTAWVAAKPETPNRNEEE
jgi:hypothetical protein